MSYEYESNVDGVLSLVEGGGDIATETIESLRQRYVAILADVPAHDVDSFMKFVVYLSDPDDLTGSLAQTLSWGRASIIQYFQEFMGYREKITAEEMQRRMETGESLIRDDEMDYEGAIEPPPMSFALPPDDQVWVRIPSKFSTRIPVFNTNDGMSA